jgi:hypothetical protein
MASQRLDRAAREPLAANDASSRWKVLLAHDGSLPTCDALADSIAAAMDGVQLVDAPSAEAARSILRRTPFDVCFVCLDLPPSPSGGIKLAQELVRVGCPIILVTRSLRWLPRTAAELKTIPWLPPEAGADDVTTAMNLALAEIDFDNQVTLDPTEEDDDVVPQRLSEI